MKKITNWITENKLVALVILGLIIYGIYYFFFKDNGAGKRMFATGGEIFGSAPTVGPTPPGGGGLPHSPVGPRPVPIPFVPPVNPVPNSGRCMISALNGGSWASTGSTISDSHGTYTCGSNGSWY